MINMPLKFNVRVLTIANVNGTHFLRDINWDPTNSEEDWISMTYHFPILIL